MIIRYPKALLLKSNPQKVDSTLLYHYHNLISRQLLYLYPVNTSSMEKTIENKIRFNIALIYITAIILCTAMLFFFYYSRNSINEQKKSIEMHDEVMAEIKDLVHSINLAQQEVNFYIATKHTSHLDSFHVQLSEIEKQIDTLKVNTTASVPAILFRELEVLLKRKGETISQLRYLFKNQEFTGNIREELKAYEPIKQPDSIEIITYIIEDTIIKNEPTKKNFWKKLTTAFSSKQSTDTIISISKEVIDTIKITPRDSSFAILKLDTLVEKVEVDYKSHITSIEKQVISLILSDQEISYSISTLLIDLYNNLLYSRLEEIKENERWLRSNNTVSIVVGLVALFLILLLIILIINDVNKGLRMRKSLEAANIRTKQLMESRHQLLLSVSHDIKTPLSSILGYLELSNNPSELTTNDLAAMRNSGKYILSLLDNLLKFSSLQQGTLTASQMDFSLSHLCEEIKEMFIPLALQKKLGFDCTFNFASDLQVTSDPLKIKQIIINILSNAIKYTSVGQIELCVRLEEEALSIQVLDTGPGIPERQIDQIFRPFIRFDENKNIAEGSGFGMYVVKGLVDLLRGKITIKSIVNKGTTVTVKLPVQIALIKEKAASPKNIWIVDDDPSFLTLLANMLNRLGHTTVISNSYSDFEECKQYTSSVDLVLTDMEMNQHSGIDILHAIRKADAVLPVFAVTGREDFNQEQALSLGFNGYLAKPIMMSALSNLINNTLLPEDHLKSLREMFDNDEEVINEIIDTFYHSTNENLSRLEDDVKENKFPEAQAICHKMLPMFLQIGQNSHVGFLQKMDQLKGQSMEAYPKWKNDAIIFIEAAKEMLQTLKNKG